MKRKVGSQLEQSILDELGASRIDAQFGFRNIFEVPYIKLSLNKIFTRTTVHVQNCCGNFDSGFAVKYDWFPSNERWIVVYLRQESKVFGICVFSLRLFIVYFLSAFLFVAVDLIPKCADGNHDLHVRGWPCKIIPSSRLLIRESKSGQGI